MPKENLVNQKSDDIPFGEAEQNGDANIPAAKPSDELALKTQELSDVKAQLKETEDDLEATRQELIAWQRKPKTESTGQPSLALQCFLAILQGFAASGELSLGKTKNDEHVATLTRHAAGVASFAAKAAEARRF